MAPESILPREQIELSELEVGDVLTIQTAADGDVVFNVVEITLGIVGLECSSVAFKPLIGSHAYLNAPTLSSGDIIFLKNQHGNSILRAINVGGVILRKTQTTEIQPTPEAELSGDSQTRTAMFRAAGIMIHSSPKNRG